MVNILRSLKKTKMSVSCRSCRSKTKSIFKKILCKRKMPPSKEHSPPLNTFNEIVFPVILSTKRGEKVRGHLWRFNKRAGGFDVGECIDKKFSSVSQFGFTQLRHQSAFGKGGLWLLFRQT